MSQLRPLSKRETEVVELLLQGKSNKLIAASLDIAERTVEFHLKNVYAKFQVSSRVELILKLRDATVGGQTQNLRQSAVAGSGKGAENRGALNPQLDRATSLRDAASRVGKELEMKDFLNTRHVPVGVLTAVLTGLGWVLLLRRFEHMSVGEIKPWIVPLLLTWALIGLSIGLVGKRAGGTPLRVGLSTWAGTGLGPLAILPLMGLVVLPAGKLVERIGLIDAATMSRDLATTLAIITMLVIWWAVALAIGVGLLFLSIKRPGQANIHNHASEPGL